MANELNQLERDVEAAMAPWAAELSAMPSEGALARVQAAVRQELNEGWLAGQPTPAPSPETVQRVRAAVREELEHVGGRRSGPVRPASPRIVHPGVLARTLSALAAAAMIALSFGLIHYAGTLQSPDSTQAVAAVTLFADKAEALLDEDPLTEPILADLETVEEQVDGWPASWDEDATTLRDVMEEIDALLAEPEAGDETSMIRPADRGAFG